MKDHLWSFGFKGLPDDQHFTLAKNEKSGINFHISKNLHDPKNPKEKPHIPILEIDKEIVTSDLNSLFITMFFGMLKEVNIEELKNTTELTFLSFDDLKNDNSYGEAEKELFDTFKDVFKINNKKTRLKVNGEWTERIVTITESEKMLELINSNTFNFDNTNPKGIDGGILVSNENAMSVIKINNKWFEISTEKKPIDMFKQIIDERLVKFIWYKIKRSIIILKSVTSWKETVNKYKPIRMIKNAEKPVDSTS